VIHVFIVIYIFINHVKLKLIGFFSNELYLINNDILTVFRYETRAETEYCMKTMNGSFLDGKQLLVDWDAGFIEGRQYSRVKRNQQRSYMHPNTHK